MAPRSRIARSRCSPVSVNRMSARSCTASCASCAVHGNGPTGGDMDDQFLHALRRTPSAEFAARLRARLRAQEAPAGARGRVPATQWLAAAAAIAAVSFAFTFPTVRAGAAAFLDMFRVVSFVGVRFDAQRLAA